MRVRNAMRPVSSGGTVATESVVMVGLKRVMRGFHPSSKRLLTKYIGTLKECESHHRHDGNMRVSRKIIERLLFETEREPHRIRNRRGFHTISSRSLRLAHIRNQEPAGHIVVRMEAFPPRPQSARAGRPAPVYFYVQSEVRTNGLCDRELSAFHAPRP